jgi:hypothetical protein
MIAPFGQGFFHRGFPQMHPKGLEFRSFLDRYIYYFLVIVVGGVETVENTPLTLMCLTFLFFPHCGKLLPFSTEILHVFGTWTFPQIYPDAFHVEMWKLCG